MFVLCASTIRMLHIAFPYTCCRDDLPAQYIYDLLHHFFVLYWFHFITLIFWFFFNIGKRVISNCSFVFVMEAPIFSRIIPVLLFCKQAIFVWKFSKKIIVNLNNLNKRNSTHSVFLINSAFSQHSIILVF